MLDLKRLDNAVTEFVEEREQFDDLLLEQEVTGREFRPKDLREALLSPLNYD